jgi:hypothetical protein
MYAYLQNGRCPAHRPSLQARPKATLVEGLRRLSNERVGRIDRRERHVPRASFVFHSTPAGMWPLHHGTLSSVARATHVRALAHSYPYLCLVDIEA